MSAKAVFEEFKDNLRSVVVAAFVQCWSRPIACEDVRTSRAFHAAV